MTDPRALGLRKLILHRDYNPIGKRIVDHLTNKEKGQLRQTSTEIGLNLLRWGAFHLEVTPDKLPHLQPYLHPRLYPHAQTPHCVCPTFEPIPADAVVKNVWDWKNIAKDNRLSVKNVVFAGKKVHTLQQLREGLPIPLIHNLLVPAEIRVREEAKEARRKAKESAEDQLQSREEEIVHSSAEEAQTSDEEQQPPIDEEETSDNPYMFVSPPAAQPSVEEEEVSSSLSEEQDFSSGEEQSPEDLVKEETEPAAATIVDPGNQLYNSFVGVKKLPAGKITIEKYLAAGAFGKVYKGQWGDKAVALKQIDLRHAATKLTLTSEEVEEAMQWEVARLATANHPNLVQFYGIYQDGNEGYTYMVMEFCDGGTIQEALKKDVRWAQRWQWTLQISEALAYLHREGVLHRDLKAENILLDRNGTAKLADLGVAQVDALLQGQEAKVVATGLQDKRFIAPEVETDQTLSTKATDIYALGLVFWQIATGKEPRKIEGLDNYRKDDWRGGREREAIPDDCPESFKKLMLECWAKEPSERPTAQGVLAKLAALGPELDPYHYLLVTAAQKLELIVHPKRKEMLAYVPPFVTQYSVDESIETYWNRIEAAQAKIEAAKTEEETPKAKEEVNANLPLTLAETFKEFIETPNSHTLLLLGEAGLGKTLTTYQWGDQLLDQWWAHINTGSLAPAYFPIFIRPEVPTWSHSRIKGAFQEVARKYNLPQGIRSLVFVDGYDELQLDAAPTNLADHLGLSDAGHAKLIVSCRPNTVKQSEQGTRFGFKGALTTRHFLPFSLDQLLGYLQQELSWEEKVYQDYKNTLGNAESVRTVLRNPFVLHLFRESWDTLSQRPLRELNRWQIYEGFIEHILKANKTLLSKKVRKKLQGDYPNLLTSYQAFMSQIAWQAFQKRGITLSGKEAKRISSWASLKKHAKKAAKNEFTQRRKTLSKVAEANPGQVERRSLLTEEDYVRLTQKKVSQAEGELPLQLRGEGREQRYEYSHKSLFEYGMAKRLLLLQHSPNIVEEGINLLNSRQIQEEPEALQFWQEGWKVPAGVYPRLRSGEGIIGSQALIEPLFEIITRSRDEETIQQASANSATLLAQAQVAFSGRSLRGVRLPGANLSGALLSYTNLAGAQLPRALLRDAYLRSSDLRGANLTGVDFGQYPSLKCKKAVYCLSYHPSGTQLAVGLGGGNIELYNQAEGAYTLLATLEGHSDDVNSVAYRPDGQQLASGSDDNTVGLWDPSSHQQLALLKGHSGGVMSVCYKPDGQQLASGSLDNTVGLWDPSSHQQLALLKGHSGVVMSVCYRPDGQQLASGSLDNTVGLWDPSSHQQLALLKGHSGRVMSVCYRPDGQQLASGSDDNTVGLWDPSSHQQLALLKGHSGSVRSVCYRPDGQQLASGSEDNTVGLWDPATHQQLALLKGHRGGVMSVCYRRDGQQLASGSEDNTVGLWDPSSHQQLALLKGHSGSVSSVCYRPDGQQLASGSDDNTVGLWDPSSHQQLALLKGHRGGVRSVCYRPDSQQLASGSGDHVICIWEKQDIAGLRQENWQLIHRFENGANLIATGAFLKDATISPSNRALLMQQGANDIEDPQGLGEPKSSKAKKINKKKQNTEKGVGIATASLTVLGQGDKEKKCSVM